MKILLYAIIIPYILILSGCHTIPMSGIYGARRHSEDFVGRYNILEGEKRFTFSTHGVLVGKGGTMGILFMVPDGDLSWEDLKDIIAKNDLLVTVYNGKNIDSRKVAVTQFRVLDKPALGSGSGFIFPKHAGDDDYTLVISNRKNLESMDKEQMNINFRIAFLWFELDYYH